MSENGLLIPEDFEFSKSDDKLRAFKRYDYDSFIQRFEKKCRKNNCIPLCVLPWKLLKSSNIITEKDPQYLNEWESKITETTNLIKHILSDTEDKKDLIKKRFISQFPESDIAKEERMIQIQKESLEIFHDFIFTDEIYDDISSDSE